VFFDNDFLLMTMQPNKELRLILASSSPQRQMLLEQAGYNFRIFAPTPLAECGVCSQETPPELVARLAYQKAADVVTQLSVAGPLDHEIVVACDTVAECVGQILGKPTGAEHARQMLNLLSGRVHHVYSGLCIWRLPNGEPHVTVVATRLRMDSLTAGQIDEYVESGQWEGKAGGFGYQDRIDWLHIEDGSESNVIGLPLEQLSEMLGQGSDPQSSPTG
jgi:septum formation protein